MSPRGFWTPGRRRGRDDAQLLLAERVHALRQASYGELRGRAGAEPEVEEVSGPSGDRFRRRTSVKRFERGGQEELLVTVRVDDGSLLTRWNPLAEEMVHVGPDGEMVGEYTMASEGNDPRRYRLPGER
jgi:hypothetical protein